MKKIRFGIIGAGVIGNVHAGYLAPGDVENAELTAVCDIEASQLDKFKETYGAAIHQYTDYKEMIASGDVDAVIISTPHYDHPSIAIDCFKAGLHVLCEKPAGVYSKAVLEMNEAAKNSNKVFSVMYCLRTNPCFVKIKELIDEGELGTLKRINWIATDWYRPQGYHNSSSWRSSWKGEGGGVIINQCPHNLDLWQWMFGMPQELTAFADFGKYYDIEVEDDVTVYMRYASGMTGVFVASTGEAPGSNRLEVAGTRGQLILENNVLTFKRNRVDEREFNEKFKGPGMAAPEHWECKIPCGELVTPHKNITQNFVNAILKSEPLIVPGEEGIHEMNLSNAIHMSAWKHETVKLPVDPDEYYQLLMTKINE